ncbi:AAA family ATPase [Aliamphritea spongicola]|uniref:AAA family ATPase n=1 Tax=Aliamphritea spongicola TaxID=707589 RepID=UPI00196AD970|nr:MoxR family ATPase [Aliamphritea spongicola]MBN3564259.1 MoxR family ATPase [Aliamphritea spongicola]
MQERLQQLAAVIDDVLLGKPEVIRLSLACLLARGHLLIEDLPGLGKTTLAHALAKVLGLDYQRIQFTSDMLPGDILGGAIYDQQQSGFRLHKGPVFTELLLADEINRTSPKTQSALLEAMEERQVSLDGQRHALPEVFFVIATQNPTEQYGTFPLPESQLDRFLMRLSIGYPTAEAEEKMLLQGGAADQLGGVQQLLTPEQLLEAQKLVSQLQVSSAVVSYLQRLAQYSRDSQHFSLGLSPRGSLAVLNAAKAWAFLQGRAYVLPDDVQQVFPAVAGHRLVGRELLHPGSEHDPATYLLSQVDVLS